MSLFDRDEDVSHLSLQLLGDELSLIVLHDSVFRALCGR